MKSHITNNVDFIWAGTNKNALFCSKSRQRQPIQNKSKHCHLGLISRDNFIYMKYLL